MVVAWLDEQLAAIGIERIGEVEQPHLRPWATVLKAPTSHGAVWLKAAGPGTAFEAGLYGLLARTAPDHVLSPIATDPTRGWIVLPDGGPPIGERLGGADLVEALVAALAQYGRLQRALAPSVDDLLALGVADMRPARMPERFPEALAAAEVVAESRDDPAAQAICRRVAAMGDTVLGDGAGQVRFYDWGDSVVAHPFAAALVPLGFVQDLLDASLDDPRLLRARDAYLDVFADTAPPEELVETLELACHVAKIARVLTWDRALQAAREQGERLANEWANAPVEALAALLEPSYLGGP